MTILLRPAREDECPALSELCLRSKGYWGYADSFLEACRDELTVTPRDIARHMIVAEVGGALAGVAQIGPSGEDAEILLLFIDPPFMEQGVGRRLFDWCVDEARRMSARHLLIVADPGAESFYLKMGARRIGQAPSGSIPGRVLPRLSYSLSH